MLVVHGYTRSVLVAIMHRIAYHRSLHSNNFPLSYSWKILEENRYYSSWFLSELLPVLIERQIKHLPATVSA